MLLFLWFHTSFQASTLLQGEYCGDIRDGEGVMSYPGGRQDVGVWRGEWLVQLKYVVHEATFDPTSSHPLQSANSLDSPDLKSRGKYGPRGPLEVRHS